MRTAASLIIPLMLVLSVIYGKMKRVPVYSAFITGAAEGMRTAARILPPLVLMFVLIAFLRTSGCLAAMERLLSPLFASFGIPEKLAGLILLRPVSGSGALAMASDIMSAAGADSQIGLTACAIVGTSETMLYTLTLYLPAGGVRKSGALLPLALLLYLCGVAGAILLVPLFA
ncbi:MAG: nucleoside recognition domain-containing protein [Eubacteriales bacterium]|nr:nucleoside recognition domain-containing protein [Eubacteriales bacterium]MDD3881990.1 nucleoside recognition domain-containing protein [Eubacteriales bacterium]MDD4513109.1 nucleoside recognition domain-containing protein [Eubacteriales bacterium]